MKKKSIRIKVKKNSFRKIEKWEDVQIYLNARPPSKVAKL